MKSSQQMLAALFLSVLALLTQAQNKFTVPDEPPCLGDKVVMYCYIEPPTSENFLAIFEPDISINGSQPYTSTKINNNQIPGIDTSRYQISYTDPFPDYPKLAAMITITSYLPQDSATTFGCHGGYVNGSFSAALASGEAPMPANVPDQINFVYASIESVSSLFCQVDLDVRFSTPYSQKPIQYYELYLNGLYVRQLDNQPGISYFNNPSTYLYMTPGESYSLRVAAVSCAGKASLSRFGATVSLPLRSLGSFYFAYLDFENKLQLIWSLSDDNSTTITIGYSLQVETSFISGNTNTVVTQTTEFSLPSTDTEYEMDLGLTSLGEREVKVNITTTLQIIEQCNIPHTGSSQVTKHSGTSSIQFGVASSVGFATIFGIIIVILILILIACAVFNLIVVLALIVTCVRNRQ